MLYCKSAIYGSNPALGTTHNWNKHKIMATAEQVLAVDHSQYVA